MTELKRYYAGDEQYYDCDEADAHIAALRQSHAQELSERDRREGELRAQNEKLTNRLPALAADRDSYRAEAEAAVDAKLAAESELATLRQRLADTEGAHAAAFELAATLRQQVARAVRALHESGQKQVASTFYEFLPPLPKEVERG